MAFSDRSQPALQPGPGPGGQSGSSPGNSRAAAPGSSPGVMRNEGECWGVLRVHAARSLPNEETEAEGVGRQPSPSPTVAQALAHVGTQHLAPSLWAGIYPPTTGEAQRGAFPRAYNGAGAGLELRPYRVSWPPGGRCTCHLGKMFSPHYGGCPSTFPRLSVPTTLGA